MQPDLFSAYRSDLDVRVPAQRHSRTSRAAAERLKATDAQPSKLSRMLYAYVVAKRRGCTDSEIHACTGIERHSICSLRAHARKHEWIVAIGEREGAYRGFEQTIWRITGAGLAAWKARQ